MSEPCRAWVYRRHSRHSRVIDRQWNSLSDERETIAFWIRMPGLARIQPVTLSPSDSRSLDFVTENTFTKLTPSCNSLASSFRSLCLVSTTSYHTHGVEPPHPRCIFPLDHSRTLEAIGSAPLWSDAGACLACADGDAGSCRSDRPSGDGDTRNQRLRASPGTSKR